MESPGIPEKPKTNPIDREALFADETAFYRFPVSFCPGTEVTFRFRTAKDDVNRVLLFGRTVRLEMEKAFSKGSFDYYEAKYTADNRRFSYAFVVFSDSERCFFNKLGATSEEYITEDYMFDFDPDFHTPEWAYGAVMYQIFPDRFRKGDPGSSVRSGEYRYMGAPVEQVRDWDAPIHGFDVRRFYGGDLVGIREKLPYLSQLGVEVLYLNPIFISPSNHRYDSQDYDYIDPHLTGCADGPGGDRCENGRFSEHYRYIVTDREILERSNRWFSDFVAEVHRFGMKLILDGVFNHCGSFHKWMDRERIYEGGNGYETGAYVSEDSPYHDYFYFTPDGQWPYNGKYLGWWNNPTLPKLNYESSDAVREEILRIAKKWVSPPYNCDGWRLDVAADLGPGKRYNHEFWRDFRTAVREANPSAILIAEHYGNPREWLRGDQWDTVMNYDAFMEPVSFFLTGMEKHSDHYDPVLYANGREFFYMLREKMSRLPGQSLLSAMNELSNHDHSRFLTRTNHRVGRLQSVGALAASEGISYAAFREGIVMQFTLPGAPTIYYGDETGVCGWTDPDCRRTYPWGEEKWDLITFHRDMIRMHKNLSFLRTGSFRELMDDYGLVVYGRFDENGSAAVVINHSDRPRKLRIPVRTIEMPENGRVYRILETTDVGYNIGVLKKNIRDGILYAELEGWSAAVYSTAVF